MFGKSFCFFNYHFGYRAVGRLRLHQRPLPDDARTQKQKPRKAPPVPPERLAALDTQLDGVKDDALRAALGRLGRAVLSRAERDGKAAQEDRKG